MNLLGLPFLLLLCTAGLALIVAVALMWSRWQRRWAFPGRAVSLLLVMLFGAVLGITLLNRSFGFYSSLDDLLAISAQSYQPPPSFGVARNQTRLVILTRNWRQQAGRQAKAGHGLVLTVTFGGPRSGITRSGLLYLPAAYSASPSNVALPVVELFYGYPGQPRNFTDKLSIARVLDTEIAARRMPPVIAAIPTIYRRRASECVDAVRGERDETYLAVDVPADVEAAFRVLPGRAFAAAGFSGGGFCAVNLGLHHPDRFSAAASLSGYFTAGTDLGTGRLYRGSRGARQRNSPLWWVSHRRPTGPALFLMASAGDRSSRRGIVQLRAAARRHARTLPIVATLLPSGGHNYGTWGQALPAALDFLGHHLPMPLAPPIRLPPMP